MASPIVARLRSPPGLRRRRAIATVPTASRTAERQQMHSVVGLILEVLYLYQWVVILQAVVSWLIAFGVINTYNKLVSQVADMLYRLTEPALRPIRKIVPDLGGVDISPIILLLLIWFVRSLIVEYLVF
jgi:YggT family protein